MNISHSRPFLDRDELESLERPVLGGYLAEGEETCSFQREFADFVGRRYGVAVSSGSAALHLALLALGVGYGDEVIIPDYVCTALLNAVNLTGARPVLCEPDPESFNVSVESIRHLITSRTKAVIIPHMFGLPAPVDGISKLGIPLIEDCAQTLGTTIKGRQVGSFGAASIFSFYATKFITAGSGGFIATDDEKIAEIAGDLKKYDQKDDYHQRFNYQWTDLQAAVARVQLSRIEWFVERRRNIARKYFEALKPFRKRVIFPPDDSRHVYFRFVIRTGIGAQKIITQCEYEGLQARKPVFKSLHCYLGLPDSEYPLSVKCEAEAVSIPIYPALTDNEVEKIELILHRVFGDK